MMQEWYQEDNRAPQQKADGQIRLIYRRERPGTDIRNVAQVGRFLRVGIQIVYVGDLPKHFWRCLKRVYLFVGDKMKLELFISNSNRLLMTGVFPPVEV
jgi:hypothetical protein